MPWTLFCFHPLPARRPRSPQLEQSVSKTQATRTPLARALYYPPLGGFEPEPFFFLANFSGSILVFTACTRRIFLGSKSTSIREPSTSIPSPTTVVWLGRTIWSFAGR